jgi:pimeloyl-ACP methyl ester carboxylesterase
MKRREWFLATAGVSLLLFGYFVDRQWRLPEHEEILVGKCRTPVRMMGTLRDPSRADVVILHGLGANALVMDAIAQALAGADMGVYVLDLPGHGNNTEPFSLSRTESCAAETIQALVSRGEIQLGQTVLLGHSLGGALAIRLADYFPTAATVAISPAPMYAESGMPPGTILFSPPRRMPANLLIFVAQFDFPYAKDSARRLAHAAGGERYKEPEDFVQRRAVRLVEASGATHTSLIHSTDVWNLILNRWLEPFLPMLSQGYILNSWFWGGVIGIAGLICLFPTAASVASHILGTSEAEARQEKAVGGALLRWTVAGLFAVSALNITLPLKFLHMYNGDYLASGLLVAGIVLCAFLWRKQKESESHTPAIPWRAVAVGGVMGMATMLAFGAWMNWTLTDTWLNAARWIRFPVVVLACLPYAFAEEWALGAPSAGNWLVKIRRYFLFIALRLLIWLSILFALYIYSSGQILLSVLVFYMGVFSIFTRLGADAVRRRTCSLAGAAVFTAILMAWLIAAVFPLT